MYIFVFLFCLLYFAMSNACILIIMLSLSKRKQTVVIFVILPLYCFWVLYLTFQVHKIQVNDICVTSIEHVNQRLILVTKIMQYQVICTNVMVSCYTLFRACDREKRLTYGILCGLQNFKRTRIRKPSVRVITHLENSFVTNVQCIFYLNV